MLRKRLVGLCAISALCFAAALSQAQEQPAGEKVELFCKFQKGQRLEYVQKMSMTQTISGMGEMKSEMKFATSQENGLVQEVTEVDDKGTATVQQKFSYIKMKQESMMGTKEFDSTKKEDVEKAKNDPMLKMYVAMLEKPFSLKIDRKWTILEVKGFTELMQELLKDNPLAEILKDAFSDEAMKKALQSLCFLPKDKVGKGDSWTVTYEMSLGLLGSAKVEYKLTFEGLEKVGERQCAKIKLELTKFSLEGGIMSQGEFAIAQKEGSGVIYFDVSDGTLVKSESKMTLVTEMRNPTDLKTPPAERIAQEMTYSMELKEPVKEEPKK
jgi:hypothetical protein